MTVGMPFDTRGGVRQAYSPAAPCYSAIQTPPILLCTPPPCRQAHLELGFPERPLKPYVRFGRMRSPSLGCEDRANLLRGTWCVCV